MYLGLIQYVLWIFLPQIYSPRADKSVPDVRLREIFMPSIIAASLALPAQEKYGNFESWLVLSPPLAKELLRVGRKILFVPVIALGLTTIQIGAPDSFPKISFAALIRIKGWGEECSLGRKRVPPSPCDSLQPVRSQKSSQARRALPAILPALMEQIAYRAAPARGQVLVLVFFLFS